MVGDLGVSGPIRIMRTLLVVDANSSLEVSH